MRVCPEPLPSLPAQRLSPCASSPSHARTHGAQASVSRAPSFPPRTQPNTTHKHKHAPTQTRTWKQTGTSAGGPGNCGAAEAQEGVKEVMASMPQPRVSADLLLDAPRALLQRRHLPRQHARRGVRHLPDPEVVHVLVRRVQLELRHGADRDRDDRVGGGGAGGPARGAVPARDVELLGLDGHVVGKEDERVAGAAQREVHAVVAVAVEQRQALEVD
eukprot:3039681-Rhodomonas_salina.2